MLFGKDMSDYALWIAFITIFFSNLLSNPSGYSLAILPGCEQDTSAAHLLARPG